MNDTTSQSDKDSRPGNGDKPEISGTPAAATTASRPFDKRVSDLLRSVHTIAVVGLSSNHSRPSYGVSRYLQSVGYRIIPVNPKESVVLGEKAYARLEDVPDKVDVVDIFRRSQFVPDVVDAAIRIGARAIWMQEGVAHEEAALRARQAEILVVMDRCIMKEHWRLLR